MTLVVRMIIAIALLVVIGLVWANRRAVQNERAAEAAYPAEGQLVRVGDQVVHAVVMGEGPDLVLIHGASGNTRDMTFSFAKRMAGSYRVIVFDRPGFGWSTPLPMGQGTLFDQARVLQAAAAELGARQPVVLGHSYGGAVAMAWAVDLPDTLAAVIPLGGATQVWPGGISTFYRITGTWLGGQTVVPLIAALASESTVTDAVAAIFAPQTPPDGYAKYVGGGLSLRRHTLRINAQERRRLKTEIGQMQPRYPQITIPVEIVHGGDDDTVPVVIHAEPLSKQINGAVVTVLDGVGHMPQHADPDAVHAAIDRAAVRAGLR